MKIETASVDAVIVYFEARICEKVLDKMQHAYKVLQQLPHIINLTPSYHSLLVEYDIFKYDEATIKHTISKYLESTTLLKAPMSNKCIHIPVDYTQGPDLSSVAKLHSLTPQEVILNHTKTIYRVYAIGFMVGFAYLAKVDASIRTPRHATPRANVPKGSVAIAQTQTAIYPQESAGGWHIIGHTDFNDFHAFEIGDSVRFVSV